MVAPVSPNQGKEGFLRVPKVVVVHEGERCKKLTVKSAFQLFVCSWSGGAESANVNANLCLQQPLHQRCVGELPGFLKQALNLHNTDSPQQFPPLTRSHFYVLIS